MSQPSQQNDDHDCNILNFSSIYSKWGEVFVKTYEIYCNKEPDGPRRHSVTLVLLAIFAVGALHLTKVPEGLIYTILALIALVFILTWKRNE